MNVARRGARHLLGSPQKLHAAIESSFSSSAEEPSDKAERKLWRIDSGTPNPILYVVSSTAPDFTHLEEQAGWPTQPNWGVADYSPLLDGLEVGQLWEFRLAANPIHNVKQGEGQRGKRLAHVTVPQQENWLAERAERLGVAFDVGEPNSERRAEEDQHSPLSFRVEERRLMNFRKANHFVTIRKVRYDGVLRVTDPVRLRHTLTQGIGAAKAYGCGLITMAPIKAEGIHRTPASTVPE